jgi:hypothetical protein
VYQKGEYQCNSGPALQINAPMAPGIYEIDPSPNSKGCDVVMDGSTPTTLNQVTFYLKGGAGICVNPPGGATITQTSYNSGSGQPWDGRYAVFSDNVGNPSINMSTPNGSGNGNLSGSWSLNGVIELPTGSVFISNKDALVDSGQVIVNSWQDQSGNHQNPSVTYNAGYAPPQNEVLQLAE